MLEEMFGTPAPIIGVVHLLPLPGSPNWDGQTEAIFQRAEQEAVALATGGVDGIIVENFFDTPFTKGRLDAATVAAFAIAVKRAMALCELPFGINCLRNDGHSAMAIAAATGASFIRVNVYAGAMVTPQGVLEGEAHDLLLYRRLLQAHKKIKVFADILVKHATPLGAPEDIRIIAKDTASRSLPDALVVSGVLTGKPADLNDLSAVKEVLPDFPLLLGSGCDKGNVKQMLGIADGAIVASSLKREGLIENPIDVERVRMFVEAARS